MSLAFKKDSPIDPDSGHSQDHPALAFDEADTLWAAWEEKEKEKDGAAKQTVWMRSMGSPSKSLQLSEDGHVDAAYPAVASGGGVTCVVYEAGKKDEKAVYFRRIRNR